MREPLHAALTLVSRYVDTLLGLECCIISHVMSIQLLLWIQAIECECHWQLEYLRCYHCGKVGSS
jgi:hypothetical protein